MSLIASLAKSKTEEDVKDAYIRAIGLKAYSKGLIDIQTEEIWFEAKDNATQPIAMFAQLLYYVRDAHQKGERIPPFLSVIDREKAALMETKHALPIFDNKSIKWPKSASKVTAQLISDVAPYIEAHFVVFKIDTNEKEFISAIKKAILEGELIRASITPDNLRQVFDKWVAMIGRELEDVKETDYALLFFADIMHDGKKTAVDNLPAKLLHDGDLPIFYLNGKTYELGSDRGYRNFWAIYHRPPEESYRRYLLERRDSLLPLDERSFKGAYYTPLHVVDKAYDLLAETLGKNWQQNYIIWDMCCGVGNLEVKHSNHRTIYMSTLDKADIDIMKASRTCVSAIKFQYDYLNDDITPDGNIDYSLTNKIPEELRQIIDDAKHGRKGSKKILVLMNPPYAEAMNVTNLSETDNRDASLKVGVSDTKISKLMADMGMGYAKRELFVQFIARISKELPTATLAMFSTLKYVNAPNFQKFRDYWKAKYLGGFVIHSQSFDGLNGDFPIGFIVWDTSKKMDVSLIKTKVLDKAGYEISEKTFQPANENALHLSDWIIRPKSNDQDALPLKGAITPTTSTKDVRGKKWAEGAIGSLICPGNDVQHAGLTGLLSSGYCSAGGLFVTPDNLWKVAVIFTVRRLVKSTWVNNRDQFMQPTSELSEDFKSDCLIWMLFNTANSTAGADNIEYNNKKWSITNHFIPFTEDDVNANGRFESDFMSSYIKNIKISKESKNVLNEGKKIWQKFHSHKFERAIRDKFKLNRPDVGWYQIRKSLEESSDVVVIDFEPFKESYLRLSNKLAPKISEFGFLN